MVEVKMRWFKLFCKRLNLVTELSNTLTLAPKPKAVRAANSPTVPAPRITTSVGATPVILPNNNPFPKSLVIINSEAIRIEAVPAISLKDFTAG